VLSRGTGPTVLGLVALLPHHAIKKLFRVAIEGFAQVGIEFLEAPRNDPARRLGLIMVILAHVLKMLHHGDKFPLEPGNVM
jgi:hypothetical protein